MSTTSPDYMKSKFALIMLDGSIVGCGQSYSDNVTRAISSIECMGSDSISKSTGPVEWDVSFDALQALSQDASVGRKNYEDLMDHHINNGTVVQVYLAPQESTDVSTAQVYYYGNAFIETISRNVPVGSDPVSYNVSLSGSGALTKTTIATGVA